MVAILQSDALVREVTQQLDDEAAAVIATAERDAKTLLAEARRLARARLHETIDGLRHERMRRLAQASAQLETEVRMQDQQRAKQALAEVTPMLREELNARWRDRNKRKLWTDAIAHFCRARLRAGVWLVEHPADWDGAEQRAFADVLGSEPVATIDYRPDHDLTAGLRIKSDGAVLDATPQGLLADDRNVAALLLDAIDHEATR